MPSLFYTHHTTPAPAPPLVAIDVGAGCGVTSMAQLEAGYATLCTDKVLITESYIHTHTHTGL
jgi:hypothetical protein